MLLRTLLLLSFATYAQAHELWIERSGNVHTLAYGHAHSGHEGAKTLEYPAEQVKVASCFNSHGEEIKARRGRGSPVTLEGDCAASGFVLSSGYWSKTPYGTRNEAKAGAVLDSWWSSESVKRINRWGSGLARPMFDTLELLPESDPLSLRPGDKLRLIAWHQGGPAAGVTVAYFGKPRGVSDAAGRINIRLQQAGFQRIEASLTQPLNDGRADRAIYSTSLQFELP